MEIKEYCPRLSKVLIEPEEPIKETAGGIILPDDVHISQRTEGTIVAVGPGKRASDGTLIPMDLKVGMFVMYHMYDFTKVRINGRDYLLTDSDNVQAIILTKIVPDPPRPKSVEDVLREEGLPVGQYGKIVAEASTR